MIEHNDLVPFNATDAAGDLDHDRLNNSFEYLHHLNMNDADTDHDGIRDGDEYHYWLSRGIDSLIAESHCRNPDSDGVTVSTTRKNFK